MKRISCEPRVALSQGVSDFYVSGIDERRQSSECDDEGSIDRGTRKNSTRGFQACDPARHADIIRHRARHAADVRCRGMLLGNYSGLRAGAAADAAAPVRLARPPPRE